MCDMFAKGSICDMCNVNNVFATCKSSTGRCLYCDSRSGGGNTPTSLSATEKYFVTKVIIVLGVVMSLVLMWWRWCARPCDGTSQHDAVNEEAAVLTKTAAEKEAAVPSKTKGASGFSAKAKTLSQKTLVIPSSLPPLVSTSLLPRDQQRSDEYEGRPSNPGELMWTVWASVWKFLGCCFDIKNCFKVCACMPTVTGRFAAHLGGIDSGLCCVICSATFWLAAIVAFYFFVVAFYIAMAKGFTPGAFKATCTTLSLAKTVGSEQAEVAHSLLCGMVDYVAVGVLLLVGVCLTTCMMTMCIRIKQRKRQDNCTTCILDCCCATWCAPCVQCQILHDDDVEYAANGESTLAPPTSASSSDAFCLLSMMQSAKNLVSRVTAEATAPPLNDPEASSQVKPAKSTSTKTKLTELNDMKAEGLIGEETFRSKKKDLMNAM